MTVEFIDRGSFDMPPVFGGVLVNLFEGSAVKQKLRLRGAQFFNGEAATRLESFFIESARFFGEALPHHFELIAVEILYENLRAKELRLDGFVLHGNTTDGKILKKTWATKTKPQVYLLDDSSINLERVSEESDYVAAYKYKDNLSLAWNITVESHSKLWTKEEPEEFRSFYPSIFLDAYFENSNESLQSAFPKTSNDFHSEEDNINLDNLLIQESSSADNRIFNLSKSDEFGTVGYTFNQHKIEPEIEKQVLNTVDSSGERVRELMEKFTIGEDEAKRLVEVHKLIAVNIILNKGLLAFRQKVETILQDALSGIREEAIGLAAVDLSGVENDVFANEVKRKGFDYAVQQLQRRWNLTPGRPKGSKKSGKSNQERFFNEKYHLITDAVKELYFSNLRETGNEFEAENSITIKAVAKHLSAKTPETLSNWLVKLQPMLSGLDEPDAKPRKIFLYIKNRVLEELNRGNDSPRQNQVKREKHRK